MLATVLSSAVLGIDAYIVKVEAHLERGLPYFTTVGLPDGAVRESKERVHAAIKNSGYDLPVNRTIINLAPAGIKKEGAAFDLPIAVGILAAKGIISRSRLSRYVILGELGLNGDVRPIRGVLSIAVNALRRKMQGLICPAQNAKEAAIVKGLSVFPVRSLRQTVDFLNGTLVIEALHIDVRGVFNGHKTFAIDFSDIKGQGHAKRALEVAAAGGHNILMIGPPGSGKTMLAKRLPTILPDMSVQEALETTKIHSVAGRLSASDALVSIRPFRSPHHTISYAGLVGGGTIPKPGEVSLAHHGVLFLDELPEFKKPILEMLRQPLENGVITIARSSVALSYPAQFMLAAAMNPCPCGYRTDPLKDCLCSDIQIQRYLARISGPLLDRIDIHIEVPPVKYKELVGVEKGENSTVIQTRVEKARRTQRERFREHLGIHCNARMGTKEIRKYCFLDTSGNNLLRMAVSRLNLSARAFDRILKVSRTIADLALSNVIKTEHIAEAIQYRSLDRMDIYNL